MTTQVSAAQLPTAEAVLGPVLAAFSLPQDRFVSALDAVVPMVAREYAAGVTAAYLGRHGEQVVAASTGLVESMSGWIADPSTVPRSGFDFAFGNAYRALVLDGVDHTKTVADIACHLGGQGLPGNWSVKLPEPGRLRWGHWLLPEATDVTITSDGTSVTCTYHGAQRRGALELSRGADRWSSSAGDLQTAVADRGIEFTVMTQDALSLRDFDDLVERVVPTVDPRMLAVFTRAIDLIEAFTPEYLPWVGRVIHQMFLLAPRNQTIESGSVEHFPGLVHLTAHPEPLPVAELLVHEATHQYMNLAAKLQPLDDGTDPKMYWSPPVDAERPVSKIVAAYHAFANVLLFYRRCRERGLDNTAECRRQEQLLGNWLSILEKPLVDNPALTASGNALCAPLMSQL